MISANNITLRLGKKALFEEVDRQAAKSFVPRLRALLYPHRMADILL